MVVPRMERRTTPLLAPAPEAFVPSLGVLGDSLFERIARGVKSTFGRRTER
jgi:hypothetical protein